MENEIVYVPLADKIAAILPTKWDYAFDSDEILKIDYSNIFGEIITISVLVNRIGVLVAEMRGYVKEGKFNLDYKEAEVRKLFRNQRSADGLKSPTVQETEDHLTLDPVIKNLRLKLIREEQDLGKLESLFEACRDKSFKLNNLSKNLTPQEFEKEIIEGSVNGVMIKMRDKHYQK